MGPILKEVSKLVAMYTHRPTEASLSPTPPHSQTLQSQKTRLLQFLPSRTPQFPKRRNWSHQRYRIGGEKGSGRTKQTLSSPTRWEKPVLLETASSPPSFSGHRLREPRKRAAMPPPRSQRHTKATNALPCSLLSFLEGKLSWGWV